MGRDGHMGGAHWHRGCVISLFPPPQTLNEPGEETSHFDKLMPATVTCPTLGGKMELGIAKQFTFASDLQVSERHGD